MSKLVWAGVVVLAACDGGGDMPECSGSSVCVPSGLQCGTGTQDQGGTCVPLAWYEIRAGSRIRADGYAPTEVYVVGTNSDGSVSHERVIVSADRANAGAFVSPSFVLDDLGGATNFLPCNSVTAGCTGPVRFDVALANAPQVPVASVSADLVAPPPVGSLAPCSGAGNIFYVEAQNFGFTGTLTIATDGVFDTFGGPNRAVVHVYANNVGHSLEMNTLQLGTPLLLSVYEGAKGIGQAAPGEPTFDLTDSPCAVASSFQVHAFTYGPNLDQVSAISATFTQYCIDDPMRRRTGCVHYSQ